MNTNGDTKEYSLDNKVKSDKRTAGPFYTLEERYPIRYRRPLRVRVQLLITGNKLKIRFYVRYAKNMMNLFRVRT
jgi:hypothetical protein